jgi:hypothetical protein
MSTGLDRAVLDVLRRDHDDLRARRAIPVRRGRSASRCAGAKGDPGVQGPRGASDAFPEFGGSGSFPLGGFLRGLDTRINLRPGNYIVGANAVFDNRDAAPFTATCDLVLQPTLTLVDSVDVSLGANGGTDRQSVSFAGAVAITAPTGELLRVQCGSGPVDFENFDMFAIQVETLTG